MATSEGRAPTLREAPPPPAASNGALSRALAAITSEIGTVPKNGRNRGQGGYEFATFDDLLDALRDKLTEHGVTIRQSADPDCAPVVETVALDSGTLQTRWRQRFVFKLAHAPSGEHDADHWWGEAFDTSDKAATKAATSAHKHYLRHLFVVSIGAEGDDPDAESPSASTRTRTSASPASAPDWMNAEQAKRLERDGWGSSAKPQGALTRSQAEAITRAGDDPGRVVGWAEADSLLRELRAKGGRS